MDGTKQVLSYSGVFGVVNAERVEVLVKIQCIGSAIEHWHPVSLDACIMSEFSSSSAPTQEYENCDGDARCDDGARSFSFHEILDQSASLEIADRRT